MTKKNYYWYFHRDPESSNEIVYVGIGTKDRAWYCRNRQNDHLDWLDERLDAGYTMQDLVELGDSSISRTEALESELALINEHRPKFNRNFRPNNACVLTAETFQVAVELRENGSTYKEIAEELGTSVMTIHRALSGGTKKYEQYKTS